ncbi:unnamed protein product [Enterobius vermicularis]|uniref:Ovule protein n=1 Tax=Enterobius vermicularis TaxID=51028 RepID=A0A0N4VRL5_ENTVE|nr:unnamed protein product [Enterobius vermicularis]
MLDGYSMQLQVFHKDWVVQVCNTAKQGQMSAKIWNASRICVSSLRRGHANLLCIVPILVYVHRNERAKP